MATLSAAGFNALPASQRGSWFRQPDGTYSTDAPQDPAHTVGPTYGYDARTNTYRDIPLPAVHTPSPDQLPPSLTALYAAGGGRPSGGAAPSNPNSSYDDEARHRRDLDYEMQLRREEDARKAAQRAADEERRWKMFQSSGAGTPPPTVSYGDDSAARAASFARAKDEAASVARSSLTALRSAMAERGVNVAGGDNPMLGAAETSVINRAQGTMGDFARDEAIKDVEHKQHVNDLTYQGNITQRAQNLGLSQSLMQLILNASGAY